MGPEVDDGGYAAACAKTSQVIAVPALRGNLTRSTLERGNTGLLIWLPVPLRRRYGIPDAVMFGDCADRYAAVRSQ